MKGSFPRACLLASVLPVLVCAACVMGPRLKVEPDARIRQNLRYDLILYGGRYSEDLYTVAIMGIEGGPYKIVPYAPSFDYRVVKDVGAAEAFKIAVRFFSGTNPNFAGTRQSRISGPDGETIGYEIRPLYQPFVYGMSDILDTSYWLKGKGVVSAWIELSPAINKSGGRQDGNRAFEPGR